MEDKKLKLQHKKKYLWFLIPVILLIIIGSIIGPLLVRYFRNSYEPAKTVERKEAYVRPAYPEIETVGTEESELSAFEERLEEEETLQAETAEEVPETLPAETAEVQTGETLPYDINITGENASDGGETSFGQTKNTISVYSAQYPIYRVAQKDKDIENILVLGTDSRDVSAERGRSDTMLIVSYHKKTGQLTMISLLRDALVPIEDHDWNRLNTAYAFGGAGLLINTVNQLFDLDIQRFVVVDLTGAVDLIDYLGGVDVSITEAEVAYYEQHGYEGFIAGECHLDGNMALIHMRNRKMDSDFGRTRRQRDVVMACVKKLLNTASVTEIYDAVSYGFTLVKTNLSVTDILSLASSAYAQKDKLSMDTMSIPTVSDCKSVYYKKMAVLSFDIDKAAEQIHTWIYGDTPQE